MDPLLTRPSRCLVTPSVPGAVGIHHHCVTFTIPFIVNYCLFITNQDFFNCIKIAILCWTIQLTDQLSTAYTSHFHDISIATT